MTSEAASAPVVEQAIPALLDWSLASAFLGNVPDQVYFKDRHSRFIAVSASMARRVGHESAADLVGKTDFDFFNEAQARAAYEDEQEIIRTGRSTSGKLEKEIWPDGRVTWVHTSKMPLHNGRGEIIGTFGISKDVTRSKELEGALEKSRRELVEACRLAGRGEIAIGVLHNVGNVLNSLSISATILGMGLREMRTDSLVKVGGLLSEQAGNLATFLSDDPKGRMVPAFIESLGRNLAGDRARLMQELESLQKNVEHIKEIVSASQCFATKTGTVEALDAATLIEDALRLNSAALEQHEIRVVRDLANVPPVSAERGKVLQILGNLISNAKYATADNGGNEKIITVRLASGAPGRVHLIVQDNGMGILAAHLTRIFQHGFTTKAKGHCFGLHFSANAAKEMKGSLTASSDGPGAGATFCLDLPAALPPSSSVL
jgi:PAS domain S-box-containing protein